MPKLWVRIWYKRVFPQRGLFVRRWEQGSGRPTEINLTELMRVIESDPTLTTWGEVASKLGRVDSSKRLFSLYIELANDWEM